MIQFFRRALSSPLILGLLALVLVAFIVTGVDNPFATGGGKPGVLSTAGDLTVTESDFQRIWTRQMEQARERDPTVTPEALARAGAVNAIVEDLTSARALEAFGRATGVRAGDALIDGEIRQIRAFQTAGRFDQTVYEQALSAQRLTDRELRAELRGDIIRRQVAAPLQASAPAAAGLAEPYARLLLERKEGLVGEVLAARMTAAPAPNDAQLRELYNKRRAQLTIPERRSFRFAAIDPSAIALATPVSDPEVAQFFAKNAARYVGAERRRVLQAAVADQAAGQRLVAGSAGGAQFEVAAHQVAGLSRTDMELGLLNRAELEQAGGAAAVATVFALPEGGVSAPVQTPFGWRVYKVEGIERTAGRTLDQVRDELQFELQRTRAEFRAAEIADGAQRALSEGAAVEEVARRFGLTLVTVPPVIRTGEGVPAGFEMARYKPLIDAAFAAEPGENATVEDLRGGRAALFQMGEIVPPVVPPFEQLRPGLVGLWTREWRARRAADLAAAVVAEVRGGKALAVAMRDRGLPLPQPVGARRIDAANLPPGQLPAAVALFLETPVGGVRALAAPDGQGSMIVQVLKATPAPPPVIAQATQSARQQFGEAFTDELTRQLALAARAAVGAKVDAVAVERLRARLAGESDATQR